MLSRFITTCAVFFLVFVLPTSSYAYEVLPMRISLSPSTGNTSGLITVRNPRSTALPIELVVQKRVFDENGGYELVDAEDDFLIFPVQTLIPANSAQSFRVQYLGPPNVDEEVAYTIDVREVPVEFKDGFSGFKFVYNFGVVVYIENPEELSQVEITEHKREDESLLIKFANRGKSFARLTNDRLFLEQAGKKITLAGEELRSRIDNVVVPPNGSSAVLLNLLGLDLSAEDLVVRLTERRD